MKNYQGSCELLLWLQFPVIFPMDGEREDSAFPEGRIEKLALQIPFSSIQTVYSQLIRPKKNSSECAIIIQLDKVYKHRHLQNMVRLPSNYTRSV